MKERVIKLQKEIIMAQFEDQRLEMIKNLEILLESIRIVQIEI
jgi:hypothetical protein